MQIDNSIVTKLITDYLNSKDRQEILSCKKYYKGDADITCREFYYWGSNNLDEKKKKDLDRSNVKVNNDFLGIIIDQKLDYTMAQEVIVDPNPSNIDINDFIDDAGLEASKAGLSWLHFYINENIELKYKVMETENILSLHDGTIEDNLTAIIRIYEISGEKYAEYFNDTEKITYHLKNSNYETIGKVEHGFEQIPFIPFYNNKDKQDDLYKIKALIDVYDLVISDFANNFIDFQELILFITNYSENASTPQAARELMEWLKKYKLISVRKDGSLDIISREVPYQARSEFLQILRNNIFYFGRGVDVDQLKGGSLTNVVIKAYFANLDMKSNKFIKQSKKFIKRVFEFLNKYNSKEKIDLNKIIITFNKSLIISEKETVEALSNSEGQISRETMVEKNPFVTNKEEELKRLNEDDQRGLEDINKTNLEDGIT